MPIRLIDHKEHWDKFAAACLRGTIFHQWDFLQSVAKHSGYQLLPYGIYKGSELICLFPLFCRRILGQKILFSPPFRSEISYMGPLLHDNFKNFKQDKKESYLNLIAREIDSEVRKISPSYFHVSFPPGWIDIRPFINLNYKVFPCFTYIWDLTPSTEEIWNSLAGVCKQNIRKGLTQNYTLEKSTDWAPLVEQLADRYLNKQKKLGVNSRLLDEVIGAFPDSWGLYYLCDNGKKITGILGCKGNGIYFAWLGLPKPGDAKHAYANEVLLWRLMENAKQEGCTSFEVFGADTPEMCSFRNKLNPRLEICFKVYKKTLAGIVGEQILLFFLRTR